MHADRDVKTSTFAAMRWIVCIIAILITSPVAAWNALGHKVIAELAWQQLEPGTRADIVATLKRHPRYAEDFFSKMPADVEAADDATKDQWTFLHAATWPDIARGIRGDVRRLFDRPTWHYVNGPIFADPADREALTPTLKLNLSARYPTDIEEEKWNIIQAWKHARDETIDNDAPVAQRAVAICWLMHLTGDSHQPLHSCALFSKARYPDGDRGGNDIPLMQGRNLHSLWDNLLGQSDRLNDVRKLAAELTDRQTYAVVWNTAANETDVRRWLVESYSLAKRSAYDDAILQVVRRATPNQPLERIELSDDYLMEAGRHARERSLAAGLRLAVALQKFSANETEVEFDTGIVTPLAAPPRNATSTPASVTSNGMTHWLNTKTGARHNSACRWFGNTSEGRYCGADEGKPCGQCGG